MKTLTTVIVKVSSEYEDIETITGENGEIIELKVAIGKNNRNNRVRIWGEAVSEIGYLGDDIVYEVHAGSPRPLHYRSSEDIEMKINLLNERERQQYKYSRTLQYESSSWSPEFVTLNDQETKVLPGDKIYFHYLSISEETYLKTEDGYKYFVIPFRSVFCVVRNREIIMVNGEVFVKPYYGGDYEEVDVDGKSIWAKFLGNTNIIESVKERPKFLTGVVNHIGSPVGPDTRATIKSGDVILFTPNSNFENEVEGELYYKMSQWDIMAKVVNQDLIPVGNYVAIKPESSLLKEGRRVHHSGDTEKVKPGVIILLEDTINNEKKDHGKVLGIGELCQEVEIGDSVMFNENGVYNIYLDEYNVLLVREEDIYFRY